MPTGSRKTLNFSPESQTPLPLHHTIRAPHNILLDNMPSDQLFCAGNVYPQGSTPTHTHNQTLLLQGFVERSEIQSKVLSSSVSVGPQVDMEINGEPVSLQMKLGDNGEAFFVTETENMLVRRTHTNTCTRTHMHARTCTHTHTTNTCTHAHAQTQHVFFVRIC